MGKGRTPCCDKSMVKKGPWSPSEDLRLINFIQKHGHINWRALPKQAGLVRCGKSCRLRWINYLRPDVKRGNFTPEEEQLVIDLHKAIGNKWSKIASYLPGRTDNEIKNVWNTHLKKRMKKAQDFQAKIDRANGNETKMDSPSCSSSSITTLGEKDVQDFEVTKKHNEKPDPLIPDPNGEDPKDIPNSNSPTCSDHGSSLPFLDNAPSPNEQLGSLPKSDVINQENVQDDGKTLFEIPFESDVDLWDLFDSLDPLQSSSNEMMTNEQNLGIEEKGRFGGDEAVCNKWLRSLENELGLTNDVASGQNLVTTTYQEPEINHVEFDYYFPIWPSSPQNLGM